MRQRVWLIKNGFGFDAAFSLPENDVIAYSIMLSEMEGNKFNWNTFKFEERK